MTHDTTISTPQTSGQTHAFEADVSKLLHMMVHSVYSDKDVFLRELISNAADACEKLRYEAIAEPALLGEDAQTRITITLDAENHRLTLEDNGIGMSAADMAETLGTIARSGTKAFMDRIAAGKEGADTQLIGQFGVGFYSAFMVAGQVDVISRRAGVAQAAQWSSDGLGTYTIAPVDLEDAPVRGTRIVLHLLEEARDYAERLDHLVAAHADAVVLDRDGPVVLVERDQDFGRRAIGVEFGRGDRLVAQLLAGIGRIRDQLAQKHGLIRIDRVYHHVQQAGDVRLERVGRRSGCIRGGSFDVGRGFGSHKMRQVSC